MSLERSTIELGLREYFADRTDVAAVYLFGSLARNELHTADVDIAVLFLQEPPPTFEGLAASLDMSSELSQQLGAEVDVVVLNGAPVDLVHRVLRDGELLVEWDRSLRIRFEVAARNTYFDLEPILKRYRRSGR